MSLAMNTLGKNYNPIDTYDVRTYSVVLINFKAV